MMGEQRYGTPAAQRKPSFGLRSTGAWRLRIAERQLTGALYQLPPRCERSVPAAGRVGLVARAGA